MLSLHLPCTDAAVGCCLLLQGYLVVPVTGLPGEMHTRIYEQALALRPEDYERQDLRRFGRSGDRIYPLIPQLANVIRSPSVAGALSSVLGRGWRLGCHRTLHGGGSAQATHKDTQRDKPVLPPVRFCFVFYYPNGATAEMGATAVFPGSHLLSVDDQDWEQVSEDPTVLGPHIQEVQATIPHGEPAIVIGHGSLLHRATERLPQADEMGLGHRPMFKLWFARTEDPMHTAPAAPSSGTDGVGCWPPFETLTREQALVPAIEALWEWMQPQYKDRGKPACYLDSDTLTECSMLLTSLPIHGNEARCVGAAYRLGRAAAAGQKIALDVLLRPLTNGQPSVEEQAARRAAVNGLQIVGSAAVPSLLDLLQQPSASIHTVASAADVIGECAMTSEEIVDAAQALHDAMTRLDQLIDADNDGGWPGRQVASSSEGGRWVVAPEVALVSCLLAMANLTTRVVSATSCLIIYDHLRPWLAIGGRRSRIVTDSDDPTPWPPTEYRSVAAAATWNLVCLRTASQRVDPTAADFQKLEPALEAAIREQEKVVGHWTSAREGGTSAPFNIMQLVGNPPFTERDDFL